MTNMCVRVYNKQINEEEEEADRIDGIFKWIVEFKHMNGDIDKTKWGTHAQHTHIKNKNRIVN